MGGGVCDLGGREGGVEHEADDVQGAVDHLVAVRQAVHATVVQLHEHVVGRLQGVRVRVRLLPPPLQTIPFCRYCVFGYRQCCLPVGHYQITPPPLPPYLCLLPWAWTTDNV